MKKTNNYTVNYIFTIIFFIVCLTYYYNKTKNTYIYINNKNIDSWFNMKQKIYKCRKINCIISSKRIYNYNAFLYSRFFYNKNVSTNNKCINILCNLEALSRWKYMMKIINGNDNKFNVLISYKLKISNHHFPYNYYQNDIDLIINDAKQSIISLNEFMKRKEVVFIYGKKYKNRNKLCEMFNKRLKVDRYGEAFKNHLKWPDNIPNEKYLLIKNYKFCLAIENTINFVKWGQMHSDPIDDDYITEKLWDCMRGGSIPIYFGAKNAKKYFPTNKSIIYSNDFKNYEELIEYVVLIKNDRNILKQYIEWPYKYSKSWYKMMKYYSFTPCKLCSYISNYNNYKSSNIFAKDLIHK